MFYFGKKSAAILPRLMIIMLISAILASVCGCDREKNGDYLAYEREVGSYKLSVEWAGENYVAVISTGEQLALEFVEPKTLADCKYTLSEQGEIVARIGSYEEVIPKSSLPAELFAFFSLSEGDFLSTDHDKISGEQVSIVTYAGEISLYLAADNSPLKFTSPSCVAIVMKE